MSATYTHVTTEELCFLCGPCRGFINGTNFRAQGVMEYSPDNDVITEDEESPSVESGI